VVFLEVLFHLIGDDGKLATLADDNTMLREMQEDAIELIHDMRPFGVYNLYEGTTLFVLIFHLHSVCEAMHAALYWVPVECFITSPCGLSGGLLGFA
jgi:hypothetical protein